MDSGPAETNHSDPSRTSIVVAALRAFGAREPDPSVRNHDSLAEPLITPAELRLIQAHPISRAMKDDYRAGRRNREVAGMANLMLIRTRFIDDHLSAALENGARQLVILGAGFDTRPYRFAERLKDGKVFEVDRRSTQEIKKRRLADASIAIPSNVRFIEIDFKKDTLRDLLRDAGYQPSEKSFFIWEGVSMYLTEKAVRDTLVTISSIAAPGSALVMDIVSQATLDMLAKLPHLPQHNYTTHWGEPWTFAVPDLGEKKFFQECGLELREILSFFGKEAVRRYLTRSDGTRLGSVTGGMPEQRKLYTMIRLTHMFLTRRSRWYAVAKLDVPAS